MPDPKPSKTRRIEYCDCEACQRDRDPDHRDAYHRNPPVTPEDELLRPYGEEA